MRISHTGLVCSLAGSKYPPFCCLFVYVLLFLSVLVTLGLSGCAGLVSGASSANNPPSTLDITNVQAAPATTSSSQIIWTTNVAADSAVDYGTGTSYGLSTPVDPAMVTNHQVTLSGLAAGTTYYYQVRSSDSKNNRGNSGGHTLKTNGFSVSGAISPLAGGSGATLTLTGAASTTTTADSSGNYTFTGLANGIYTVTPSHSGFTFTPSSQSTSINGANVTGLNFTDVAQTFGISGAINSTGGSGATVALSGAASATTSANSSGAYTFSGLASGSYTITPSNTGYTFAPSSQNVTLSTINVTGVNFTANGAAVAPTISTQPANQTVTAGQAATFTVVAAGTAPLSYQWQKNSASIAGATAASYTTPATTTADSGATFAVVVSNTAGSVTSSAVLLTVNPPPAQITATPVSASFGNVVTGTSNSQTIKLTNNGGSSVTISQANISGAGLSATGLTVPVTIAVGGNVTFNMVFAPTAVGAVTGSVSLVSNAPGSPTVVSLNGTGVAPTLLLGANPTILSFGNVNVGSSSSLPATLTNNGNSIVTIASVTVSGTGFSASGVSTGTILTPGQSVTLNIAFVPAAAGNVIGSVSVVSNATNSPTSIAFTGSGQPALQGQWISGYYSSQNGVLPVSSIPWSKYTHIIHFAAAPGVDINGNGNGTVELHYLSQADINALTAARPTGKQVLVCIKDNDSQLNAFAQSTSPAMIATFVANVTNFVNTNQYDGVDIDWEQNINVTQYNDLLTRLRTAMPAKVITIAAGNWGGLETVAGASYSQLDQINLMCYDMDSPGNGFSWYNDALLQSGNLGVATCDWRARAFTNAGVAASKIGVGIPFYGRRWPGVIQALITGSFNPSTVLYRDLVTDGTRWQPQYQFYDSIYKSDYLSIPSLNEFISYNGTQSIKDAVAWQKSQGFGGFMTFTLEYEYLSNQTGDSRYPLSTTLHEEVFGVPK